MLSHQAAFQTLCLKPVTLHGFIVTQGQDPELHRVEPHKIGLGPSSPTLQTSLQSLPALQQIKSHAAWWAVHICELTEGVLTLHIIDKVIKKNWSHTESEGTELVHRQNSIYHTFFGFGHSKKRKPFQAMSSHFFHKNVVGTSVKGFTKALVISTTFFAYIRQP